MPLLFTYFTGEQPDGEQVYFSVSRDGLRWEDLNGGRPVLRWEGGTGGARDPFPVRDPATGRVFVIATDLCIGAGTSWREAVTVGSRDLVVWQSDDLLHWSAPRARTVGIPGAGNVWAPEAVFDGKRGVFFVFFASNVKFPGENEPKQRVFGTFTGDFDTFSKPFLYLEDEMSVIDTTLVRAGDRWVRVTKSEVTKRLTLEASEDLYSGFTPVPCPVLDALYGVEGPEAYPLPGGGWCLIADRFAAGLGYLPMVSEDLAGGQLRILGEGEYDMGRTKKRHGGVLTITEDEYRALLEHRW